MSKNSNGNEYSEDDTVIETESGKEEKITTLLNITSEYAREYAMRADNRQADPMSAPTRQEIEFIFDRALDIVKEYQTTKARHDPLEAATYMTNDFFREMFMGDPIQTHIIAKPEEMDDKKDRSIFEENRIDSIRKRLELSYFRMHNLHGRSPDRPGIIVTRPIASAYFENNTGIKLT